MMHYFTRHERTTEFLFHDQSVFSNVGIGAMTDSNITIFAYVAATFPIRVGRAFRLRVTQMTGTRRAQTTQRAMANACPHESNDNTCNGSTLRTGPFDSHPGCSPVICRTLNPLTMKVVGSTELVRHLIFSKGAWLHFAFSSNSNGRLPCRAPAA